MGFKEEDQQGIRALKCTLARFVLEGVTGRALGAPEGCSVGLILDKPVFMGPPTDSRSRGRLTSSPHLSKRGEEGPFLEVCNLSKVLADLKLISHTTNLTRFLSPCQAYTPPNISLCVWDTSSSFCGFLMAARAISFDPRVSAQVIHRYLAQSHISICGADVDSKQEWHVRAPSSDFKVSLVIAISPVSIIFRCHWLGVNC